jgi:hypothetical protein
MPGSPLVATWADLAGEAPDLAGAARKLLINCAPDWGIALLGTIRQDGSPRIGPLCTYIVDGAIYVTVEGNKENDLQRDPRYFLHSYWGGGQDEAALSGVARRPVEGRTREKLVAAVRRMRWSPVIRELEITAAHAVTYRNFPSPDMYADVISWHEGEPLRRWRREDPAPIEDRA